MNYQCQNASCLHTFTHPAKQITPMFPTELITHLNTLLEAVPDDKDVKLLADMFTDMKRVFGDGSFETYVCPFCHSKDFSEYIDLEADIVSVKSVDLNEVDTYLKDGYVVEAMFAKTATIKKLAVQPPKNPDSDDNQAFEENSDLNKLVKEAYAKLPEVKP